MPVKRHSVSASNKPSHFHFGPGATCRSQVCTLSTSYSHFSLPERTSTSLPRLPSTMPINLEAKARAEKLERWMLRSSMPSVQSWSTTSDGSRPSSASSTGCVRHSKLGKPTKTSMLRSKTCPATLVDYKEQIQKQKVFDFQCKVLSSSILSQTLPNGEKFHGFLLGARYNSAYTLDSHSRERCGVHVLKKNTNKLFVNRVGKKPSAKVFGTGAIKNSHNREDGTIVDHLNESHVENIENADSSRSIERQLDEMFGPDEEGSSSETTVVSVNSCSEGSTDGSKSTQILSSTLDESPPYDRSSEHDIKEAISQLSLSHSDNQSEENEQDFISHEAQELTQEILQEYQISTSSLSNQTNDNFQINTLIDEADTNSTKPCIGFKTNTEHNSFQAKIDNHNPLSQCSLKRNILANLECQRPVSAPFHREINLTQLLDKRPKSARTDLQHSQIKTASSIVVDMSSFLQTVEMEDSPSNAL